MADERAAPSEATRRVEAVVPHTHWDRGCSGLALTCGDTPITVPISDDTGRRPSSFIVVGRRSEDWLRTEPPAFAKLVAMKAPPIFEPMLMGHGMPAGALGLWSVEPKLDGWRAMATVVDGRVELRTRRGRTIDDRVPTVAALAGLGVPAVFDGELVADAGRAVDFYALGPALARRNGSTAFVAFDVLWLDGHDLTELPYDRRRAVLDDLDLPALGATVAPRWPGEDAEAVLAACSELGVEGMVLKRRSGRYEPGRRSTAWRKVKCQEWREVHLERRRPTG